MSFSPSGPIETTEMLDSTNEYIQNNWQILRNRLAIDGYLLIREAIPPETVLDCRKVLLDDMIKTGFSDSKGKIIKDQPNLLKRVDLMKNQTVLKALEHDNLIMIMSKLYKGSVTSPSYKWIRAVGTDLFTGPHIDRTYMKTELLTCWIPLGHVTKQQGSIIIAKSSHKNSKFKKFSIKELSENDTSSVWVTNDANDIPLLFKTGKINWKATDFNPGDVCIFGVDVLHLTGSNKTSCWRLSCDTRWLRT